MTTIIEKVCFTEDTLIKTDDGYKETTPTHPFWVMAKGWVVAGDMEVGDKVYLYSGEGREIRELKFEYLDSPIKVYNFEVEDWHTYFVSEQDVFVHNECKLPKQKVTKQGGVTIEHYYPNDHGKILFIYMLKVVGKIQKLVHKVYQLKDNQNYQVSRKK